MVVRRLPVREPAGLPWQAAFEALPAPVLMLGPDGALLARNAPARTLLGALAEPGAHCCELLGCRVPGSGLAGGCLADLAQQAGRVAEREVRLDDGATVSLSAD